MEFCVLPVRSTVPCEVPNKVAELLLVKSPPAEIVPLFCITVPVSEVIDPLMVMEAVLVITAFLIVICPKVLIKKSKFKRIVTTISFR